MTRKTLRFALTLFVLVSFFGCAKPDAETWVIPQDTKPAIALLSTSNTNPTNSNFVLPRGASFSATFRLDDNEALRLFRVTRQYFDERDVIVGGEDIRSDVAVQGKHISQTFTDIVPNVGSLPDYYKIRFRAYAIDMKGEFSFAEFWVSVIPDSPLPSVYSITPSYAGSTVMIYSAKSNKALLSGHRWRFSSGTAPFNTPNPPVQNIDIEEKTTTPGDFAATISSPSGAYSGDVDVIAMTDVAHFNYNTCNFDIVKQFYLSYYDPKPTSTKLQAGDIVIIRQPSSILPNGNRMYTVMHVIEVNDAAGDNDDYIKFEFRYTYL